MQLEKLESDAREFSEKRGDDHPYDKCFRELLSEYGVDSPGKLPQDKKTEFFKTLKERWINEKSKLNQIAENFKFPTYDGFLKKDYSSDDLYTILSDLKTKESDLVDLILSAKAIKMKGFDSGDMDLVSEQDNEIEKLKNQLSAVIQNKRSIKTKLFSFEYPPHNTSVEEEIQKLMAKGNEAQFNQHGRNIHLTENKISTKDEFEDYAYTILKKAHGENFDKEKADKIIADLIKKYDSDFGAMIGALNS
jgi:hypothetical protein